jgi:predicted GTPase
VENCHTDEIEEPVDIDDDVVVWTLNDKQQQAFKIITKQNLHSLSEPLQMFLGGAVSTGKSQVINALRDYFEC